MKPEAAPVARLVGLPPIIDARARVLILGSFPSPASLRAGQYYGHRQNQFWPILGDILGLDLRTMAYASRQAALRGAGFAVWDVFRGCEREGSLDSAIRNGQANDLAALPEWAPRLSRVCFNGRTAGRFAPRLGELGYETLILPSTSPAYTLPYAEKLAAWRNALAPFAQYREGEG